MTFDEMQETMELSTVETIMSTINNNIIEFYNFVRIASNDNQGRQLLDKLLKLKGQIREYLYKDCERAKERYGSKAIATELFERTRSKVEDDIAFMSVMDSLCKAFSDFFVYIVIASDDEEGLKLHNDALAILEEIDKYVRPKIVEMKKRLAEDNAKKEAEAKNVTQA